MSHTVCLSDDGETVWAFGDGDYGKLGLGTTTAKTLPTRVEVLSHVGVKSIACGMQFTVVLTHCGVVYTFGQGLYILTRCFFE